MDFPFLLILFVTDVQTINLIKFEKERDDAEGQRLDFEQ